MSKIYNKIVTPISEIAKIAGIEYPDQMQMEQDFSMLAHQFIVDRAQGLVEYMIGFEVVDRNNQGSRVVGIFAFKVGGRMYFVPVFFLNGQIKGMVSIFDRESNTFSQLTDANIGRILRKAQSEYGKSVDRAKTNREADNMNTSSLRNPYTKIASAAIANAWRNMTKQADMTFFDKIAGKEFTNMVKRAKGYDYEPYDPDDSNLKTLVSWLGPKADETLTKRLLSNEKIASSVDMLYGNPLALHVPLNGFNKEAKELSTPKLPEEKGPGVEVIMDVGGYTSGFSNEIKGHVQAYGFDMIDRRKEDDLSEVHKQVSPLALTAPDKSGRYRVFGGDGALHDAMILLPGVVNEPGVGGTSSDAILILDSKISLMTVPTNDLLVMPDTESDKPSIWDSARKISDGMLQTGKTYILVDRDGDYLYPFSIVSTIKESGNPTVYRTRREYIRNESNPNAISSAYSDIRGDRAFSTPEYVNGFVIRKNDTGKLGKAGGLLVIPDGSYRIIEPKNKQDIFDPINGDTCTRDSLFYPGNQYDLNRYMYEDGVINLNITKDASVTDAYIIDNRSEGKGTVNYKQAAYLLTYGYNIHADNAKQMLKEANLNGTSKYTIRMKKAQAPYLPEQDVFIPPHMFPEFTGYDPYTGAMTQQPMDAELEGTQTQYLPPSDPGRIGIQDEPLSTQPLNSVTSSPQQEDVDEIDDVFQLAQIAAETGQRTVFDHAGIAGLSKLYDLGGLLDSYIPEMAKAVDRLGRLAFLFYWRNDGFSERFGEDAMPEVEDTLLGVYRQFGDLVVKLMEESTSPPDGVTF